MVSVLSPFIAVLVRSCSCSYRNHLAAVAVEWRGGSVGSLLPERVRRKPSGVVFVLCCACRASRLQNSTEAFPSVVAVQALPALNCAPKDMILIVSEVFDLQDKIPK